MPGSWVKNVGTVVVSNATTGVLTVPAAGVAAGNLVIVRAVRGSASATSTIADTGGNTYTLIERSSAAVPVADVHACRLTTALVSGNTITITWSSKGDHSMGVDEFSGLLVTEDTASATATGASTTPSVGMTPALAGLVVGTVSVRSGGADSITEDSDTTNGSWVSFSSPASAAGDGKLRGAYKLLSASGAQTYNPVLGTSKEWNALIAAFTPIATSGPFDRRRPYRHLLLR